jgi:hypothetical protein
MNAPANVKAKAIVRMLPWSVDTHVEIDGGRDELLRQSSEMTKALTDKSTDETTREAHLQAKRANLSAEDLNDCLSLLLALNAQENAKIFEEAFTALEDAKARKAFKGTRNAEMQTEEVAGEAGPTIRQRRDPPRQGREESQSSSSGPPLSTPAAPEDADFGGGGRVAPADVNEWKAKARDILSQRLDQNPIFLNPLNLERDDSTNPMLPLMHPESPSDIGLQERSTSSPSRRGTNRTRDGRQEGSLGRKTLL